MFKLVNSIYTYKGIFDECSKEAAKRGYDFFSIQYREECWGSRYVTYKTYDRVNCMSDCRMNGNYGIGPNWANFVYYLKRSK